MAGNAGAIRAGRAFIELFADDSKLSRGLRTAEAKLRSFGAGASAIGSRLVGLRTLFGGALFGGFIKSSIGAAAHVYDLAKRTGMSAEAAGGLKYAADQTGTSVDALATGVAKMQKNLVAAADGSKQANKALDDVGLSAKHLMGLKPEEQFRVIADALAAIEDPAQQTAAAMAIFGRGGAELIPLLEEGAAGIDRYVSHARKLGLIMSAEDAAAADELDDKLGDLWATIKSVGTSIGLALAPALQNIADTLMPVVKLVAEWVKQNPAWAQGMLYATGALAAAGIAMQTFGLACTIAAPAIAAVRLALTHPPAAAGLAAGIGAGVLAFRSLSAESDRFAQAWEAIKERIKSGDMEGAFKIVTTSISFAWRKMLHDMQEGFANWWADVRTKWTDYTSFGGFFNQEKNDAARAKIEAERVASIKASKAELDQAKKELDAAIAAAKGGAPQGQSPGGRRFPKSFRRAADLDVVGPTRGTFSGLAAERVLGSTSVDERIAKAAEGTERQVAGLRSDMKHWPAFTA